MVEADTTRRLLTEQIVRLWGAGEIALVRRNYAPNVVDHMPVPGQAGGLDGMEQVVRDFRAAMPDLRMELHGTVVNGDRGCDFWTLTGANTGPLFGRPPTGALVEIRGIDMIRAADGKVADLWHVEEMLQLATQLGQTEAPAADPPPIPLGQDEGETWAPDPATLTDGERYVLQVALAHVAEAKSDTLAWLRTGAPDLRVHVATILVDGDLAAIRWSAAGAHTAAPLLGVRATGEQFAINGMEVLRIVPAGRIDWVFHVEELAQLRAQLTRDPA